MASISAEGDWIASACQKCGAVVRVDRNVEQLDPAPTIYCAVCWPWPLLPAGLEPEDFARGEGKDGRHR